jgi:nucleoside 2-deoxyribosyltransferase
MTKQPRIYFARALDLRDEASKVDAVESAREALAAVGLILVDPVAELRGTETTMSDEALVRWEVELLRRCDGLLVDLSIPAWQYIGTICEMVYARMADVPTAVFTGENPSDRPWLRAHADAITKSVNEAAHWLAARLGSGDS